MVNISHSLAIIGIAAICTLILRAFPFMIFSGRKAVPAGIHYLGKYLPAAVMSTLVFYCLRGINVFTGSRGVPELIATVIVIILHVWKKNILLTVMASTICYMIMVQWGFGLT
jgi:branched-subunit amino acid transport protein AzlD